MAVTFPVADLTNYIDARGGFWSLMDALGYDETEKEHAWSAFNYIQGLDSAPMNLADRYSIDWLGVHPGEVWSDWFAIDADEPDYDAIEEELLSGRHTRKADFWQWVQDHDGRIYSRNDRDSIISSMAPEARAVYRNELSPRIKSRRLAVGSTCRHDHKIETEADLVSTGSGMAPACVACRRASNQARRANKRGEAA